jgi:hypothetical protein
MKSINEIQDEILTGGIPLLVVMSVVGVLLFRITWVDSGFHRG